MVHAAVYVMTVITHIFPRLNILLLSQYESGLFGSASMKELL